MKTFSFDEIAAFFFDFQPVSPSLLSCPATEPLSLLNVELCYYKGGGTALQGEKSEGLISEGRLKKRTAALSIVSNLFLVIFKLLVGLMTGSIAIISEAIHSSMDLLASFIAFFSVRKSSLPPDECHPFGHGKYEDLSGMIEAMLIVAASAIIIWESLGKIIDPASEAISGDMLNLGIIVMGISAGVNLIVSRRLLVVAKQTDSIALESDALHLLTDVYTSAGVCAGLILIRLTGWTILDPLIGVGVALVILKAAYGLIKRSYMSLMDYQLTESEMEIIRGIICRHGMHYADYHALRTRRAGPDVFIDFHLLVEGDTPVEQAHDLASHLEHDLKLEFPRSHICIHIEPSGSGDGKPEPVCPVDAG